MITVKALVARVKRAYKKRNLSPVSGTWCNGKRGVCPMSALYLAAHPEVSVKSLADDSNEATRWAEETFGTSFTYKFFYAFDWTGEGRYSPRSKATAVLAGEKLRRDLLLAA